MTLDEMTRREHAGSHGLGDEIALSKSHRPNRGRNQCRVARPRSPHLFTARNQFFTSDMISEPACCADTTSDRARVDRVVIFRVDAEEFVDPPNDDCYSVDPQPIGCDKEARRWMYTSRRSGAEGFFFTRKRASLTPANTRLPRASPPAPALPVPPLPDSSPAPAEAGQRPASKTGDRRSDQGA
jgi:hypothetical protein